MRPYFLLVLPLLFFSCRRGDGIPSGVLPPEKMEAVLWDMMRADQFNLDHVFSKDSTVDRKEKSMALYRQVMSLHKVSQKEFRESFYYYRARPELLKMVMDSITKLSAYQIEEVTPKLANDTTPVGTPVVPDTANKGRIRTVPLY